MNLEMYFSGKLKTNITKVMEANKAHDIEEIRLRVEKPIIIKKGSCIFYLNEEGELTSGSECGIICKKADIDRCLELMSDYSLYAFNEEIRNGFITLPGGHRVGVCGQTVYDGSEIKTIKNIASMNIRIAREHIGISDRLITYLFEEGQFCNTLILSPPGYGKTSLLRDIVRNVSDSGINISVIDERSEIAACYKGIPQNNVGICTDVLDMAPKSKGILMVLRSMSPRVIAVDEINASEDLEAIKAAGACGASLLCTMHMSEAYKTTGHFFGEKIFTRYIYLENYRQYRICDSNYNTLAKGDLINV